MENKRFSNQTQHEKQVLLQIWLPLILGITLVLLLCVMAVVSTSANSLDSVKLASISLILIILPALLAAFLFIALLAVFVFGLYKLTSVIPYYSLKVQSFFELISNYVTIATNRVTQPVINTNSRFTGLRQFFIRFVKPTK
jgi:hypothetical protein